MNSSSEGLWMPPASSTIADSVDGLYFGIYWICIPFFFLILIGTVYFAWKYRRRHPDQLATSNVHHNTRLEVAWTVIPAILCLVVFVWGFRVFLAQSVAPATSLEYRVTAKRWAWTFADPDDCVTYGELHVPAGVPIKLVMRSDDVIHSFFVPDFRIKADVLPGRYSTVWFEVEKANEDDSFHQVLCTEYCGTDHSAMLAKVYVHDEESYATKEWCKLDADPVKAGEKLYNGNACVSCHTLDGSPKVGPTFKGLFGRKEVMQDGQEITVDENYITESIRVPTAKVVKGFAPSMPAFPQLKQEEIDALIAFIKAQQ